LQIQITKLVDLQKSTAELFLLITVFYFRFFGLLAHLISYLKDSSPLNFIASAYLLCLIYQFISFLLHFMAKIYLLMLCLAFALLTRFYCLASMSDMLFNLHFSIAFYLLERFLLSF
jgi:hypothetical protein